MLALSLSTFGFVLGQVCYLLVVVEALVSASIFTGKISPELSASHWLPTMLCCATVFCPSKVGEETLMKSRLHTTHCR